jgi:hypothetical protein
MLVMQRSHRRRDDLSWLAPEVARAQRRAAWSVWGGSAVAIGGTVAMLPPLLLFWKGFVLAGAGIAAAGHQVGRMTLQRQLRKLAAGQLPLSALDARAAGELVVVRGRIECAAPLTGILVDSPGGCTAACTGAPTGAGSARPRWTSSWSTPPGIG